MSLDYDISRCPATVDKLLSAEQSPITKAIIFACMPVKMGEITEKNYVEFFNRNSVIERLHGAWLKLPCGDSFTDRPLTLEDVRLRIGLTTNVCTESFASFWRSVGRGVMHSIREQQEKERKHE